MTDFPHRPLLMPADAPTERDVEALTGVLAAPMSQPPFYREDVARAVLASDWFAEARREAMINFATWLSGQKEIDVFTPDEAVDQFLRSGA